MKLTSFRESEFLASNASIDASPVPGVRRPVRLSRRLERVYRKNILRAIAKPDAEFVVQPHDSPVQRPSDRKSRVHHTTRHDELSFRLHYAIYSVGLDGGQPYNNAVQINLGVRRYLKSRMTFQIFFAT